MEVSVGVSVPSVGCRAALAEVLGVPGHRDGEGAGVPWVPRGSPGCRGSPRGGGALPPTRDPGAASGRGRLLLRGLGGCLSLIPRGHRHPRHDPGTHRTAPTLCRGAPTGDTPGRATVGVARACKHTRVGGTRLRAHGGGHACDTAGGARAGVHWGVLGALGSRVVYWVRWGVLGCTRSTGVHWEH